MLTLRIDYAYDAFDQLIRRGTDNDGPGGYAPQNKFYAYEDGQIVLGFEYSGMLTSRFLWGPQTDQLLVHEAGIFNGAGTPYYPLAGQQNTIHDAAQYNSSTGTSAVVIHRYGDAYSSGGSWSNYDGSSYDGSNFAYTGRYQDQLTGLQWHLHRWYDPYTGRWLSEDPIGFAGGDTNLYRYVHNSPTNRTDPSGLFDAWQIMFASTPRAPQMAAEAAFKPICEAPTVWKNTKGMRLPQRLGTTVGTTAASYTGVRGASDFFSPHDAVDAHEQTWQERAFDGLTGGISLAGIGYGGMRMAIPAGPITPSGGVLRSGAPLYRTFGGEAPLFGRSWSTVPPELTCNPRGAAGLFPGNTGQAVARGILMGTRGVTVQMAAPGPTTPLGALQVPEVIVNDAYSQVRIIGIDFPAPPH